MVTGGSTASSLGLVRFLRPMTVVGGLGSIWFAAGGESGWQTKLTETEREAMVGR
jgi:hypothetical protein